MADAIAQRFVADSGLLGGLASEVATPASTTEVVDAIVQRFVADSGLLGGLASEVATPASTTEVVDAIVKRFVADAWRIKQRRYSHSDKCLY